MQIFLIKDNFYSGFRASPLSSISQNFPYIKELYLGVELGGLQSMVLQRVKPTERTYKH